MGKKPSGSASERLRKWKINHIDKILVDPDVGIDTNLLKIKCISKLMVVWVPLRSS